MTTGFDTVTIIGVGLLGGSLGLALKERGLARQVLGVGHRQATLDTARSIGAVDETFTDLRDAAPQSDLIVVCTPAATVPDYLDALRPLCRRDAIVTDVASTKAEIAEHIRAAWAEPYRFIGSHPMAGSEKYGPGHAAPDLYADRVCFVESLNGHDVTAHRRVVELWRSVGARVELVEPGRHDSLVARTSHVPHIAAAVLVALLAEESGIDPFIGAGFRDTTRVAAGRPEVWRDICLTNAEAIRAAVQDLDSRLAAFASLLERRDESGLLAFFERAREARHRLVGEE